MRVADGRKMSSPCSDQTQSHFRNQMCQKVGKTPLKKPLPHLETLELFHMLSLCMTELVNWRGEGVGVGSAVRFISLQNQTRPDGRDRASPQRRQEELPSSFQRKRASFTSRYGRGHPGGAQGEAGSGGGV